MQNAFWCIMMGMKDTTGQRGRTIELMIPIALIAWIAAVVIPNFYRAHEREKKRDRELVRKCAQGHYQHLMMDYAMKHKHKYPVELDGQSVFAESGSEKLRRIFGDHWVITNFLENCHSMHFSISKTGYTLTVAAKDRGHTLLTITPKDYYP